MKHTHNRNGTPARADYRLHLLKLSLAALFMSLSIILTRYVSIYPVPSIRIGFGSLPIQLAGIFLGPIWGAAVGLIGDPLGFALNPVGTYHIGFTLSAILNGVIPALIARLFLSKETKDKDKYHLTQIRIAFVTTLMITVICSVFLNTLWLSQMLGTDYKTLLVTRLVAVLANAVAHFVILAVLLPALERAGAARLLRAKSA